MASELGDKDAVATALSFDAPAPAATGDADNDNADAFKSIAATPKPRAVDKENATKNRGKRTLN
jgi:hypothetical protein